MKKQNNLCFLVVSISTMIIFLSLINTNTAVADSGSHFTYPVGIAFDPNNGDLYVSNIYSNIINVIQGSNNTVIKSIHTGVLLGDGKIIFDPVNKNLYAMETDRTIGIINTENNTLEKSIKVNSTVADWAVDYKSGNIYIADQNTQRVNVISGINGTVLKSIHLPVIKQQGVILGYSPISLVFDSKNGSMYVVTSRDDFSYRKCHSVSSVVIINDTSNTVKGAIDLGGCWQPNSIELDSKNGKLYIGTGVWYIIDTYVLVVDTKTSSFVDVIPFEGYPNGGDVPGGSASDSVGDMYMADTYIGAVDVIDGNSNKIKTTVSVGSFPDGVAFDSKNCNIYVTNWASKTVSVINSTTNTVIATIH